jgi:hypothetical protein
MRLAVAIAFCAVLVLPASAFADDFAPAPWRGDPLSYIAEWDFEDSDLEDQVPSDTVLVGDGVHAWSDLFTHMHPYGLSWEVDPNDPLDGRVFTEAKAGSIEFFLGNWVDDYDYKYIWVQIAWGGNVTEPSVYETYTWTDGPNIYGTLANKYRFYAFGPGGAQYHVEEWVLPINPDREYANIYIPPGTWVDQIIIETVSRPSPHSWYLPTNIYGIQLGNHALFDSVEVDSVVVTAVDLKPDTYGFMAQELPGGPWSGVLCYSGGTDPYASYNIEVGDIVAVQGVYDEYGDPGSHVTELLVDSAWVMVKGYGEPACTLLSCADLGYGAEDSTFAERWEGVYVCVDTVQVVALGDYEEWTVVEYHSHTGLGFGDSLRIDDKLVDPSLNPPGVGDTLSLIKGVYSQEWGNYRLWPRTTEDLEFMGPPPGPNLVMAYATSDTTINALFDRNLDETSAEWEGNYFLESETSINLAILTTNPKLVRLYTDTQPDTLLDSLVVCDVESEEGTAMFECQKYGFMAGITPISYIQQPGDDSVYWDTPRIVGEQVTVAGVVTSSSPDFDGPFFMRDGMGPWNGIFIYWPGSNVTQGDTIVVSGVVDEYYGLTEISSVDYFKRDAVGTPPAPDTLTNTVLMADSLSIESYEGCYVFLDSMDVVTYLDAYDEWLIDDLAYQATVKIGDFAVEEGAYGYDYPGLGSLIGIYGCWRYNFGEHKLEPRKPADIVVIDACSAGIRPGDGLKARLHQNAPNPFIGVTAVRFAVPSATRVKVAIYDVTGRLVKELANEVMTPGEYTVNWNGRDSRNREVGPGIYFYTFKTPEVTLKKKMVLLK